MAASSQLLEALSKVVVVAGEVSPDDPDASAKLERAFPAGGREMTELRALLRSEIEARTIAERENDGVRFSRIKKAATETEMSIDVVHMSKAALGHTHPNGEIDLCFAVSGDPRFDGKPEGWQVFPTGSWHVPTVSGGAMDILYFLPGGAIRFEPKPA